MSFVVLLFGVTALWKTVEAVQQVSSYFIPRGHLKMYHFTLIVLIYLNCYLPLLDLV